MQRPSPRADDTTARRRRRRRRRQARCGRQYAGRSWQRIQGGDTGVLPVIAGLIARLDPVPVAELATSSPSATSSTCSSRAPSSCCWPWAEVFALLLGEIDLSIGFVAGLGGVVMADAGQAVGHGLAVVGGHRRRAARRAAPSALLQGTLITRLGLPSFVVTLAGLLVWQGVMLLILGDGGVDPDPGRRRSTTSPAATSAASAGWIVMLVRGRPVRRAALAPRRSAAGVPAWSPRRAR